MCQVRGSRAWRRIQRLGVNSDRIPEVLKLGLAETYGPPNLGGRMHRRAKQLLLLQVVSLGLFGSRKGAKATPKRIAEADRRASMTARAQASKPKQTKPSKSR